MSTKGNKTASNTEVKPKREYIRGLTPEEKRVRVLEQKRLWVQRHRANEENRRLMNAYNNEKQKHYYAIKKSHAISTF